MFIIQKATNICEKVFDGTHDSPKYISNGYPLVTSKFISNNVIDLINPQKISRTDFEKINLRSKVEKNDILISMIGTVGLVTRIKEKPNFAIKNIGVLRPKSELDSKYLLFYLQSNYCQNLISTQLSGSTQQYLSLEKLRNLDILYPINDEYKQHIVNTIGTIDDLIEKYNEIIKKIEEYLLLEYKKLNVNTGLKFKDVFKVFNGGTFKSSDYVINSKYKLITIKNIDSNGFNTDSPTYIPLMTNYEKYQLNIGDILLTMTGAYLGRSGIVDEENCYLNQRVLKIESHSRSFLYCFLKHNQQDIFNLGKGSAQPNLSLADLFELPVNYSIESIFNFKKNDRYFECLLNFKIKIKQLKTIKNMFLNKFFG